MLFTFTNPMHTSRLTALIFLFFFQLYTYAYVPDMEQKNLSSDTVTLLNDRAFDLLKTSYDSSRLYADSAYKMGSSRKLYREMVRSLITKGVSYYYSGSHDKAMQWYMEALKLADQTDDPVSQAKALNEMGVLNRKNGNLQKAESRFLEALRLSKESGDSVALATSMNNLGVTYDILEKYDLAMDLYKESAEIKRLLGDTYGLTFNLDNMGQTMAKMGNYKEGEEYFLEAARLRKELEDETGYAITINNIGELYLMKGDEEVALRYFKKALAAAEKLDYKDFRLHLYKVMSDTYTKMNEYKLAFDYLTRSASLKDSVFNEQRNKQIEELQTKYEMEKKEQELTVLKAESELQAIQIRQGRSLILGIIVLTVFVIAAVILFNSRRHYKLKAQLAEEKKQLQKTRFKVVIDAEEKERKRIARDLHDGLGQLLSTARLAVSSLDEEEEDPKIQNTIKLIDTAVQEVRNISHNMMPNALASYGLEKALEDLVRKINLSERIQVSMEKNTSIQFDESQSVAVYRVVQEIFNNAIKYAEASKINFTISEKNADLTITITDDGKGFDPTTIKNRSGIGWSNVYSRMELIGGQVSVFSRIKEGTSVMLTVPVEQGQKSIAS